MTGGGSNIAQIIEGPRIFMAENKFKEIYETFRRKGVKYLETNPELEENKNIQALWGDYNPVNHKRRRTYAMEW